MSSIIAPKVKIIYNLFIENTYIEVINIIIVNIIIKYTILALGLISKPLWAMKFQF